jgi:hypothetical protein
MGRSSQDYGIYGLDDATLRILAGDVRKYGEKGKYAAQELAQRKGMLGEADSYRAALERAAYSDAGAQYGAGNTQIANYLAGAGPMADGGAATALRYKLASSTYGAAKSRIGNSYADFLKQMLAQRRQYNYQRALADQQNKANKKGPLDYFAGAVGGAAGMYAGGAPKGVAQTYGSGSRMSAPANSAGESYYG